jgi:hypothetical protein
MEGKGKEGREERRERGGREGQGGREGEGVAERDGGMGGVLARYCIVYHKLPPHCVP